MASWYTRFICDSLKNTQRYKIPFLDGFFQKKQHGVQNPKFLLRIGLLGFLGCAYYWNLERVPYTNRSHFVITSTSLEKFTFRNIIKYYYDEGTILPPLHPSSIRVQRIGQEIVEAAQKGLRKEVALGENDYNYQIPQFEWEFVVVDLPIHHAECLSGGKIVVFTGLLDTLESDVKIAADIAHEVGHAIGRHGPEITSKLAISNLFLYWTINLHLLPAISKILAKFLAGLPYSRRRHCAEKVSRLLCLAILMLFLYWKANLSLIPAISKFLIILPSCRRHEMEADYIGVILMAGAGYDPRVYVEDLEKRDDKKNYGGGWSVGDYAHTHPSNKKRAQLLSQPKVMEEALSLYEEALMQRRAAQINTHRPTDSLKFWRQVYRRLLIRDKD